MKILGSSKYNACHFLYYRLWLWHYQFCSRPKNLFRASGACPPPAENGIFTPHQTCLLLSVRPGDGMVDVRDSKSRVRKGVWVRLPPWPLSFGAGRDRLPASVRHGSDGAGQAKFIDGNIMRGSLSASHGTLSSPTHFIKTYLLVRFLF